MPTNEYYLRIDRFAQGVTKDPPETPADHSKIDVGK